MSERIIVNVVNCARCEISHKIEFKPFKKNPIDNHGFWGICSNTGDPVLLKIENVSVSQSNAPLNEAE